MPGYRREPGAWRDDPQTAARYLAGIGYDVAGIEAALSARVGVTGWSAADIARAARTEHARQQVLQREVALSQIDPIPESAAALNPLMIGPYRYGLLFTFGDGEARTVMVTSDSLLSAIEAQVAAEESWAAVEHGSPTGRMAAYDPVNAVSVRVITFERR